MAYGTRQNDDSASIQSLSPNVHPKLGAFPSRVWRNKCVSLVP